MSTTRKCLHHDCACSTVREIHLPKGPCDCRECVAYKEELLEQYEAERGTWQGIIDAQGIHINRLQGLLARARPYVRGADKTKWKGATSLLKEIDNE